MALGTDLLRENFKISIDSIRANLLRSILTILIIAIGIMALVGILTAIDAIKNSITDKFQMMGANTFTIQSRGMRVQIGKTDIEQRIFPISVSDRQNVLKKNLIFLPKQVFPFLLLQ